MFLNDNTVKVETVKITWDGLTNPDTKDDGSVSHNIGFAIDQNAPEFAELEKIVQDAVNNSSFNGNLPAGANPALKPADVTKFGPNIANHYTANASTMRGMPAVFDEQGKQLSVDQLRGVLYPGCEVSVLVHAYAYNNKQRGVKFGIDGVQIKNRNASKFDVAAGMSASEVANAFGAQSVTASAPAQAPATAPAPAAPTPPPAPANDLASGKVMTPAANGVPYDEWIAQGWTDEQLIQNGYMAG